ncbi:MAG: hypothetical protein WEE89_15785 [Gemmatimonadota bacterium]
MSRVRIFVGTKRGLFHFSADERRTGWITSVPLLPGREIYFIARDPRDGSLWAGSNHKVWGPHLHRSTNFGDEWETLETAPHYADERGLRAVWSIAASSSDQPGRLYAGIEPAGLFQSDDGGASWREVHSLNQHATATAWQPAGGALALHSITVDPLNPQRIVCAVSAGGVYRTDDGGVSWQALNQNVRADFLPQPYPEAGQCVHKLVMHPANPDRLYQQNHCGVYRSDDAGNTWIEVFAGLPSNYGYALAVDSRDPNVAFVIPEESSHMRTTVGGRLRVYRTTDAGSSWQGIGRGMPQEHAYVSVLREGMSTDNLEPTGVYFGTSGGHLFASRNRGENFNMISGFLPRILAVMVVVV